MNGANPRFRSSHLSVHPGNPNVAPKESNPKRETHLPAIIFQGLCQISGVFFFWGGKALVIWFVTIHTLQ